MLSTNISCLKKVSVKRSADASSPSGSNAARRNDPFHPLFQIPTDPFRDPVYILHSLNAGDLIFIVGSVGHAP